MPSLVSLDIEQQQPNRVSQANKKVDALYLIYSSIWGMSAGAVIAKAFSFSSSNLLSRLTPIILPLNWLIFPFKPHVGFVNPQMRTEEKIYRIACFSLSTVGGFILNKYIFCQLPNNSTSYAVKILLLTINLLASKKLNELSSTFEKMDCYSNVKRVYQWLITVRLKSFKFLKDKIASSLNKIRSRDSNITESKEEMLNTFTQLLIEFKAKNAEMAFKFERLKKFIEGDHEIIASYQTCLKETRDILLPPPPKVNLAIPITKHPVLEELRKEMHENHYYEMLRDQFLDFYKKIQNFALCLKKSLLTKILRVWLTNDLAWQSFDAQKLYLN